MKRRIRMRMRMRIGKNKMNSKGITGKVLLLDMSERTRMRDTNFCNTTEIPQQFISSLSPIQLRRSPKKLWLRMSAVSEIFLQICRAKEMQFMMLRLKLPLRKEDLKKLQNCGAA